MPEDLFLPEKGHGMYSQNKWILVIDIRHTIDQQREHSSNQVKVILYSMIATGIYLRMMYCDSFTT